MKTPLKLIIEILGFVLGFIHIFSTATIMYPIIFFFGGLEKANNFMDDIAMSWIRLSDKED